MAPRVGSHGVIGGGGSVGAGRGMVPEWVDHWVIGGGEAWRGCGVLPHIEGELGNRGGRAWWGHVEPSH